MVDPLFVIPASVGNAAIFGGNLSTAVIPGAAQRGTRNPLQWGNMIPFMALNSAIPLAEHDGFQARQDFAMKPVFALMCCVFLGCASLTAWSKGDACDAPQSLSSSSLLFLGEMHGSREAPALAGEIVCSYAKKGPVALGLELPPSEQDGIDRYLASNGDADAKRRLLSGDFWRSDKDGRASSAMVALIESVRRLRHEGSQVTVFEFSDILPGKTYDASIAEIIRDFHARHPGLPVVALMGNVHASQTFFQVGGHDLVTAASLLRDLHPTSVLLAYQSGTIWACMPDCGVHKVASEWGVARKPGLYTGSPMGGYASSYVLPGISASPPAVGETRTARRESLRPE